MDAANIDNPYWELVKDVAENDDDWIEKREKLTVEYAWAIPSPSALNWIVEQLNGRPVVEIGAGTGYWAYCLRQLGVSMHVFDDAPPDRAANHWHSPRKLVTRGYTEAEVKAFYERWGPLIDLHDHLRTTGDEHVIPFTPPMPKVGDVTQFYDLDLNARRSIFTEMDDRTHYAAAEYPDHVLMLCWPPEATSMAYDAATAYTGDAILYCGDERGGRTGDDAFFDYLADWTWHQAPYGVHRRWPRSQDELWLIERDQKVEE